MSCLTFYSVEFFIGFIVIVDSFFNKMNGMNVYIYVGVSTKRDIVLIRNNCGNIFHIEN